MKLQVSTPEAYQLFHEGSQALAQVEANGICIDVPYLTQAIKDIDADIKAIEEELRSTDVYQTWRKRFGNKLKLWSHDQLGALVYGELGYEATDWTAGREGKDGKRVSRPKVDKESLERVDHPFVKLWRRGQKLRKAKSPYLDGIVRECVDGYIHPVFNLHLVDTWRSSCWDPNIQNQPIRDPETAERIRKAFIARDDDRVFLEIDLSQIEVRIAAVYTHDPVLINYVSGGGDMHHDMAMECFLLTEEQVTKLSRYVAKNRYVFPGFYGSYYVQTAPDLWDAIEQLSLCLPDGTSLYRHLAAKGITELGACDPKQKPVRGTLEHHIQKVDSAFWNERFRVYTDWKKRWYSAYQRTGGVRLLTGFYASGIMSRNKVLNIPIQGVAFHVLLWSLIQLQKWLRKNKMKSKIVGQVHDSILIDCHIKEMDDVIARANYLMTKAVRKHWDWIIVPLEVEAEASPPGGSWYAKKKVEI